MNLQIQDRINEISERARARFETAVSTARKGAEKAAGRVSKGKKPVKTVSRLGVKLSDVSHRTVNKLWKRQTKLVESQIDTFAGHLKVAAKAESVRNLVESQIGLIPENASRFKDEAREALNIFKDAGGEIREIVKAAVVELRTEKPDTGKKPAAADEASTSDDIAA